MENIQYKRHFELANTHWWFVASKQFFDGLLQRYIPHGGRLLDAGSGVGTLAIQLRQSGFQIAGIDFSGEALRYSKQNGFNTVAEGTVEELPFLSESFDGVISLDVLYHEGVRDEVRALREMTRVTKPGGYIFLQLPAYEWLSSVHDRMAKGVRRYTAERVRRLLEINQLKVKRITYRVSFLFPAAAIARKIFQSKDSDLKPGNSFVNQVLTGLMRLENILLRRINFPFGLSVVAVAQKL